MKRFYKPVSKENIGSSSIGNTSNIHSEKRPRQEVELSDNDVISDPGLRKSFRLQPVDKRDLLRRRYLAKGPCQPRGHQFPITKSRKFKESWYERFPWIEYSVSKDKAYCLWCYLFPEEDSNKTGDFAFAEVGFSNWKKGKDSLATHEASKAHNNAQSDVRQFLNQKQNIDVVLTKQKAEVQDEYRTRLTIVVRITRYLLGEGLAFRGNDESENSIHRGHFLELVDLICLFNEEVDKVMRNNAPKNNQLTSSTIQRDIIACCAKETRKLILNELGDRKFSLLLDESRDSSIKEQMAVVVRFVNDVGEVIERFLGVVHVTETSSQGLKNAVDNFFAQNGLSISRLQGQGYDGASNMRGELNGLKTLILNDNRNAHYIHCFAHQIQLVVVSIAEDNHDVSQFFDYVSMIVNMVGSSCKRLDALRKSQYEEVLKKIQSGEISTGSGKNQEMSLARPGTTRWGSHYKTLIRLFGMWNSIEEVLLTIKNDGDSRKTKGTAKGLVEKMGTFEFVFIGKLMLEILSYFEPLSSALQAKDQDIGNAICMVGTLKEKLQSFRDEGWEKLMNKVIAFCAEHNISVPNLEDRLPSRCVSLVNGEPKTLFHYYRVEIMMEVVDAIFKELNRRFTEANTDLLQCIMCLNPSKSFAKFNLEALLHLARMYPDDFSEVDVTDLSYQLQNYIDEVRSNSKFSGLEDLGSLSRVLVENNFHTHFALVYRLIELALILPVATASVERAFSAMNIVKTDLRNKLGDVLLSDCLVCYIEKKIFFSVDEEDIMQCFQKSASRRNILPPLRFSSSSSRSVNQI